MSSPFYIPTAAGAYASIDSVNRLKAEMSTLQSTSLPPDAYALYSSANTQEVINNLADPSSASISVTAIGCAPSTGSSDIDIGNDTLTGTISIGTFGSPAVVIGNTTTPAVVQGNASTSTNTSNVGSQTATAVAAATTAVQAATSTITGSTIPKWDGSGNLAANNFQLGTGALTKSGGVVVNNIGVSFVACGGGNGTLTGTGDVAILPGAGALLSSGSSNILIGSNAGAAFTNQNHCVAIGQLSQQHNTTADTTSVGAQSLLANTLGTENSAFGAFTLEANNIGSRNTAVGYGALNSQVATSDNTAVGADALENGTTGSGCTAVGSQALMTNTADNNTAVGSNCLRDNNTGSFCTGVGGYCLSKNTFGLNNTAMGQNAMTLSTTASGCTAIGASCLSSLSSGGGNITAVGQNALTSLNSGTGIVAVGNSTGSSVTSNTDCTMLGSTANVGSALTNAMALGAGSLVTSSNTIQLGNTSVITVNTSGTLVAPALKITTSPVAGNTLISDATGNATWHAPNFSDANGNVRGGTSTLTALTIGTSNSGYGTAALSACTSGIRNTMTGANSGAALLAGSNNTGTGYGALNNTSTSLAFCTAIGSGAGDSISGNNSTCVGAGSGTQACTNATALGYQAIADANDQVMLGNSSVTQVKTTGKVIAPALQITTSPTSGYVLMSDSSGNATWQAPTLGSQSATLNAIWTHNPGGGATNWDSGPTGSDINIFREGKTVTLDIREWYSSASGITPDGYAAIFGTALPSWAWPLGGSSANYYVNQAVVLNVGGVGLLNIDCRNGTVFVSPLPGQSWISGATQNGLLHCTITYRVP